jgi:hypothetical protein
MNGKTLKQESWDFTLDLNVMPYNQRARFHVVQLEVKRRIEAVDKKVIWMFGFAEGRGRDVYCVMVNQEADAEKIRNLTFEFDVLVKLVEVRRTKNDSQWLETNWVNLRGTFGHGFNKGRLADQEDALNQEPDKNFDEILKAYGTIMRPTKTDYNMIEVEDENGKKTKVRGPMATMRSLKILLADPMGNPIPQQLNYISPNSTRTKIIATYYKGQPWFCRPCQSFHTDRFCPERSNNNMAVQNPNSMKRKIMPTDETETIVLSASELRKKIHRPKSRW